MAWALSSSSPTSPARSYASSSMSRDYLGRHAASRPVGVDQRQRETAAVTQPASHRDRVRADDAASRGVAAERERTGQRRKDRTRSADRRRRPPPTPPRAGRRPLPDDDASAIGFFQPSPAAPVALGHRFRARLRCPAVRLDRPGQLAGAERGRADARAASSARRGSSPTPIPSAVSRPAAASLKANDSVASRAARRL